LKDLNILIIIPARGGSKGIPRKNLRPLNGKPLIFYAINNAVQLELDNVDCYVSSEDEEILLIASKFGAKTIKRASNFSNDITTLDPVIYDALTKAQQIEKKKYNLVITLQPTSPLLKKETIRAAILQLVKNDTDTYISGTSDSHLTWTKEGETFVPNYKKRVNRQELPETYKETGGFVITKEQYVSESSRFGNKVEIYPVSKKEAIDIDDFEDWSLCEYYLKRKTILFVVAGNSKIGMGHVYNALSIANEILSHSVVFLVDKNSELAFKKISESNYKVILQEKPTIQEHIFAIGPDVIVNDMLDTSVKYMKLLKQRGYKLINFEDLGAGSKLADTVINAMYPEKEILENHFFGSNYFILRDEFLFTPNKIVAKEVTNILISFGGVDPNNYTERIIKLLLPLVNDYNLTITVVTGMGYENVKRLDKYGGLIILKRNTPSMSNEILNADLIFTSAGRTTFEIASIGTPAIVLCQNQRETTHFFAYEKNGFDNLGLGFEVDDKTIVESFKNALVFENRLNMSKKMLNNNLKSSKARVLRLITETIES